MKELTHVLMFVLCAAVLSLRAAASEGAVYRVGPDEVNDRVSKVAGQLTAGDVVEITGNIADRFTLTADGTWDRPITIRGIPTVKDGRIVRPSIDISGGGNRAGIACMGDWIVIEGLDITGARVDDFRGGTAIWVQGDNFIVRNCRIHHNRQGLFCDRRNISNILIEFCEFDSNGALSEGETSPLHSVYLRSTKAGAIATIRHCYFHNGTGGHFVKSRMSRNVLQYNWFENTYCSILNIVSPMRRSRSLYPMHSDIVGNVFDQGRSPYTPFCLLQLGGDSSDAAGTEGDFNIAHNLFVTRAAYLLGPNDPTNLFPGESYMAHVQVHGNVDHLRFYNNVFMEWGVSGSIVYERGTVWKGVGATRAFAEKRGSTEPVIEGSYNWISERTRLFPSEFRETLRGDNAGFVDVLTGDFRPGSDSELGQAGLAELPRGQIVALFPEFEPSRGIPTTLKARVRKDVSAPSIGPFETVEAKASSDGVDKMILAAEPISSVYDMTLFMSPVSWPLPYGQFRRLTAGFISEGRAVQALGTAKAQFILCPMDPVSLDMAIASVKEALIAFDGDEVRAGAFEQFAKYGGIGADGQTGTEDDLEDPLRDVAGAFVVRDDAFYNGYDETIDERAAVCSTWQVGWYETEKAFIRLSGGRFEEALSHLALALEEVCVWIRRGEKDRQKKHIVFRVRDGLSVVYRERFGTVAGFEKFLDRFEEYIRYGPEGNDGQMGTEDDLKPPI